MAIVDRDAFFENLASGTKWSAGVSFTRTNALPIDDKSVFDSLENAQTYAQSATAYPGQVIAVVTSSETTFYGINQNGELQDLGGSTAPMLFVESQEEMLALEDIDVGQQVYREDTHTIWLYKGGTISDLSSWVESAAANDTVWFGTQNKVNFYALTNEQYTGVGSKDANTLYFVTDRGVIYKGTTDVTSSVLVVTSFPEASAAVVNKLYVNTATFELQVTTDNASWIKLSPGYLTDGANWAEADGNKFATIALIKSGIEAAVANKLDKLTGSDTDSGKIVVVGADGKNIAIGSATIGGATLSGTGDATKLATEAAVEAAISWNEIQ